MSDTGFLFGHNIHDFDPDKQGKRTSQSRNERNYERSRDSGFPPQEEPDSLVSEILAEISAITQKVQEKNMISYGDSGKGERATTAGGIPRLKMENMSFEKRVARILAVREENSYGEMQVIVKVAYVNQTYLWYLKKRNPNLKFLVDSFGSDETKWIDEEFFIYLENDSFNNRNTVKASLSEKAGKKR